MTLNDDLTVAAWLDKEDRRTADIGLVEEASSPGLPLPGEFRG